MKFKSLQADYVNVFKDAITKIEMCIDIANVYFVLKFQIKIFHTSQ